MNRTRVSLMLLGAAAVVVVATGFALKTSKPPAVIASANPSVQAPEGERWYDAAQVRRGEALYQTHCATCHKPDAAGTPNWKEPGADGHYPPPPLNGTAHAWHHPLSVLRRSVQRGGAPLGGVMPGFAGKLDQRQIDDILAWVQSHWDERIYAIWRERDAQSRSARR